MVDALAEASRVVSADGCVLDLRPQVADLPFEVATADQTFQLGTVSGAPALNADFACRHAINEATAKGWLVSDGVAYFTFALCWDSLIELKAFLVDHLPDVHFDVGELYSGLIPIENGNDSRALFFAFQPKLGDPVDEVTIWLNGGPGCSSLEGFFQENGRFLWLPGTYQPVENPYSWVNLTNVLWYAPLLSLDSRASVCSGEL